MESRFFSGHAAMSGGKTSPYKCTFCSDRLMREKFRGWRRLLIVLPVRDFKCPHCFAVFTKPIEWIGQFLPRPTPVNGNLKRVSRKARRAAESSTDRLAQRLFRVLSKFGKWVTRIEESTWSRVKQCVSWMSLRVWKKNRNRSHPKSRSSQQDAPKK